MLKLINSVLVIKLRKHTSCRGLIVEYQTCTYTWILLWAEKVPDLNPAKFSAGFRKKNAGDLKKHPDPRF